MSRSRLLTRCCAFALCLGFSPAALAQDDAPQIDPDSPAGTEYELPIDRAREEAGGGASKGPSRGEAEAPLFGEGVDESGASSGGGTSSGSRGSSAPSDTGDDDLGVAEPKIVELRAQASTPTDGGGSLAAAGGGAAGVLLIGALAGLAWRRRTLRR